MADSFALCALRSGVEVNVMTLVIETETIPLEQNETRFDPHGVRERLLARRASQKAVSHASLGR